MILNLSAVRGTHKVPGQPSPAGHQCPSALIPKIRPSHCPQVRISNVKPAHASDNIYTPRPGQSLNDGMKEPRIYESMDSFLRIYMQRACTFVGCTPYYIYKGDDSRRRDIKSTHVDVSRCITAVLGFKVAKFDLTDSNVKKTSFRDWPYKWPEVSFHRC